MELISSFASLCPKYGKKICTLPSSLSIHEASGQMSPRMNGKINHLNVRPGAGDEAQLGKFLPGMQKALDSVS